MSDDYWDYADEWSVTDDPSFEDAAREWADENSSELVAAYSEGDLIDATIRAHDETWPLVERSFRRAKAREASGDFDEAAFHLSRTLEGYVRAVYLKPVFDTMTAAFGDRLKLSKLDTTDMIPSQLKNAGRLLLFALVGMTQDAKDAVRIRNRIKNAFEHKAWTTRNEISHTLSIPTSEAVASLEKQVSEAVTVAAQPIHDRIKADEERRAANKAARKRGLDDPF